MREPPSVRRHSDPLGRYAESVEISGASRVLFISGQVPTDVDGTVPAGFAEQCRNAWQRVLAVLEQHDMRPEHLAKVTTFLRDRGDRELSGEVRGQVLGEHLPALTVVVAELYEPDWLVEIEAIALA
ncbi:RidA family protein [Actinosynnema pretiosum subsp. pretiosum]|uniref:Endoribonuclease L-PSP n=2 Tax=Actinosynnema TaxID=40566 RepID=C6WQB8_ACTMD|nr:RidA family protein [Actinosynnema mirum]ACU36772.1 Endoribonuclease L-PSP [Actinosynnema mirum DSM 43827]AXX30232.1 Endoribonuclease L-PSP [Actinosynnema pretiosum subsp. pretiosum]QUF05610.1 RidA family protein [Actinosynnema pretiosum subsp. pretiosum]